MKPEEKLHRRVVAELRLTFRRRGFEKGAEPFFHCPNESMVPPRYRSKLAAMGLSPGVPDLVIVSPIVYGWTNYPGLALELKSRRGRPSAAQSRWLEHWRSAGFLAAVGQGPKHTANLLAGCTLINAEQHYRICEAA